MNEDIKIWCDNLSTILNTIPEGKAYKMVFAQSINNQIFMHTTLLMNQATEVIKQIIDKNICDSDIIKQTTFNCPQGKTLAQPRAEVVADLHSTLKRRGAMYSTLVLIGDNAAYYILIVPSGSDWYVDKFI